MSATLHHGGDPRLRAGRIVDPLPQSQHWRDHHEADARACGAAEKLGLSETAFAIYGLLRSDEPMLLAEKKGQPYGAKADDAKTALATVLEEQLEPQVSIVDWVQKSDVQREMRRVIKNQLRAASFPSSKIEATAESICGSDEAEAAFVNETSQIQFGMTTIPYAIRRTAREKTVALTIEGRGKLVVTAPSDVALDKLNDIVRRKARWVIKRIRRVSDLPPPPTEREFASGETVRYLGGQYRLKVVESKEDFYPRLRGGWYEVPVPRKLVGAERRLEVRRRLLGSLKQHADLYLPNKLAELSRRLDIERPSLIVCEQKKRWGSCDRNGVLRINWRIIQAHIPLIEYVLVHEIAHLQNRKHDHTFWLTVALTLPDYEERRARLRELGPSLIW